MPADTGTAEGQHTLTVTQAARLLDVHPDTIRRWADNGLLPSHRTPTNQRRFLVEDIQKLLPQPPQDGDA